VSVPGEHASRGLVVLDDATVRFGRAPVLRDVSLSLHRGEYVCVRGANGAGKTTLLRLLVRAVTPAAGRRRGPTICAYVPAALTPPPLSVGTWLKRTCPTRPRDPMEALAVLGFDGDLAASCRELSFGNLRKVLLAYAFTLHATLIAIDEVHVGLDHAGREGLDRLVAGARSRAAVVVAAQDDEPVEGIERTLLVHAGRVTEVSSSDLVRRTLRGPRAAEAELLDAAQRLGFRPVEGDATWE
jgi:zinc transport system ATP-binding protein